MFAYDACDKDPFSNTFWYTKREYSFSVNPIGYTPAFLFVFVIIRLFRFRCTFYHVNDYGIKLYSILRCDDRMPCILFDILTNLTGIAAATTSNLLTFRKAFRLMCTVLCLLPLPAYSVQFPSYSYYHEGFLFSDLSASYIAE